MNPSSDDLYSQAGNWLMGTARRNPEGLLLLAAGCALLMRKASSHTQHAGNGLGEAARNMSASTLSDASSQMRRAVSNTTDTAADYAADLKDRVAGVAGSYADSVSDLAGDTRRAVVEGSERLTRQAQNAVQTTMDRVLREQPLAVAMLGVAAGAAVAAAFPATDVENRVLGGTHEALSNAVDQAGKTVMSAASKAGERLKTAAADRGFNADGLKDLAGEVAETFTDAVSGKSESNKTESNKTEHKQASTSGAGSSGAGGVGAGGFGSSSGASSSSRGNNPSSNSGIKPNSPYSPSGGSR